MGIVNHFRKTTFKSKVQVVVASHLVAMGASFAEARNASTKICLMYNDTLEWAWDGGMHDHDIVARELVNAVRLASGIDEMVA